MRRIFSPSEFRRIGVSCLLVSLIAGGAPAMLNAQAEAAELPLQHLSLSFDLAAHRLLGAATIELPPGTEATLDLAGLHVTSLVINGAPPASPAAGQTLYSLPAQAAPQTIALLYDQLYEENGAGLLGPEGIALTGNWHPRLDRETLFKLSAQLPPGFSAVSEAERIKSEPGPGGSKVSFDFPWPARGINFIAAPYVVEEEEFAGGKKLYSYFFEEDRELAAPYRKKTLAYLQRYRELLGEYPFSASVSSRIASPPATPCPPLPFSARTSPACLLSSIPRSATRCSTPGLGMRSGWRARAVTGARG